MRPHPPETTCPIPSTLARFLREELVGDELPTVEAHVGACSACQRALDELLGSLPGLPPHGSAGDSAERPPELPGHVTLDRIDTGGMGVVWRVRDREFDRPLALKVVRAAARDNPQVVRRLLTEARITGRLTHPCIVPVHAMGRLPDGRPYFTMKLVEGKTLAALLGERPAPASQRQDLVQIFAHVCQAVAHAHTRGVIHRDLKPANVMVGAFGEVQVMDWGLAKALVPEAGASRAEAVAGQAVPSLPPQPAGGADPDTQSGVVLGTWPYMPPEQARGEVEQLDRRCDVFTLGAILCEILTGEPPYRAESREEVRRQAAGGDLADSYARLDACGADAELVALARACLVADRERRLPDAGAVTAAISAYQSRLAERLQRAEVERSAAQVRAREERKRRRLASGFAVAVLVGLVGLGVGAALLARTNRQLSEANSAIASARADAIAEQRLATSALERAFNAFDSMTSALAGDVLGAQPALTDEQRRFLSEVLVSYHQFANERGEDEGTRRRSAAAAFRVALIQARLGQFEPALRSFEMARDRQLALVAVFENKPTDRRNMAVCLSNFGRLYRELDKPAEAETAYRHSLEVCRGLVADFSTQPDYQRCLARALVDLGTELRDRNKHSDAEGCLNEAVEIHRALVSRFPQEPRHLRDYASTCNQLGLLLRAVRPSRAEKMYREALCLLAPLIDQHPREAQYRYEWATIPVYMA